MPRRARHLIPTGLPRRGEVIASSVLLIVAAHLLLAQLTFVLAALFALVTRVSRWRLWWLGAPAAAGLAWVVLTGPGIASSGFAAGPAHVLGYLGGGPLAARISRPSGAFAGAADWLPGQLPFALVAGSAEAAVIGWLAWLRTDEWAVPPARPGAIAALRAATVTRLIRAGAVLTRDGCALGVAAATGSPVTLSWAEASGGVLVTGASELAITVTSLQLAHGALRRRKPLIILDLSSDAAVGRAVAAACAATQVPLYVARAGDADFGRVIRQRTAVLLRPESAADAARACADIVALENDLRRIGVDGDGCVWICGAHRLPAQALRALLLAGPAAGLPAVLSTALPAAAAELADVAGAVIALRLADPDCAAKLAERTGTRLRPRTQVPSVTPADPGNAAELVPHPAVPGPALLSLGPGEFVLVVSAPRYRLVERGRLVPARLPSVPPPPQDTGRELVRAETFSQAAHGAELDWRVSTP